MFFAFAKRLRLWALLAGVGSLALTALPAHAQYWPAQYGPAPQPWPAYGPVCPYPTVPSPRMVPLAPLTASPAGPSATSPAQSSTAPTTPPAATPTTPQAPTPTTPQAATPETTPQTTPESEQGLSSETAAAAPSTEAGGAALGAGTFSATGYIDNAIPFTNFRLRFDAAYDDNRPDRANFFYAQCGCNNGLHGPGPNKPETRVDYQDLSSYLELALDNRASAFIEVPVRFLNPEQNANASGLSDINAGFKYALIASPDTFLTFQLRTYFPTGEVSSGLGNGLYSLEPALLWHEQMGRFGLDTEFRDWIPLTTDKFRDGSDFAGNVTRYGVGLSYLALNNPRFRIIPVVEFVGWTVLSGKETEVASVAASNLLLMGVMTPGLANVRNAAGDTIVNAKVGVRFGFGSFQETGFLSRSDLYVGYGRALTGDVWYKDILRVEYRILF